MAKKRRIKLGGRRTPIRVKKKKDPKLDPIEEPPEPRGAQRLVIARRAKRSKAFRRRAAAAKRTRVGQTLKKAGVPFIVSAKDLKIIREPKPKSAKAKITKRNIQTKNRASIHMRRASLFRVTAEGPLRVRAKRILTDPEGFPISPRGRVLIKGVTDPFQKPPKDQPQSVQDYFLGSRAIRRRAYDPSTRTLEVVFTTGYGYHFFDVPYSVWLNWLKAQSAGRFFMNQIYGHWTGPKGSMTYHPNYKYTRIF